MTRPADLAAFKPLSEKAWQVREHAYLIGPNSTKVGCAALCDSGAVFTGCNVQHRYRCHDIHAEVNAIGSLAASGGRLIAILIVAERASFTPCGGCMDWIMELGDPSTQVGFQSDPEGPVETWLASELMPHYPRST
jgi:cytidine deaminase